MALALLTGAGRPARGWQMKQAPLTTRWASLIDPANPLPEYPRPQLVRPDWLNLNGIWQFQPANSDTDPVPTGQTLASSILVPYPMESAISGVMQYSAYSFYRRTFTVPAAWSGRRILLHLDAVDWQSEVFVNGQSLGVHKGGYDPVSYDVTNFLSGSGAQELIVRVYSPEDTLGIPRGKQTLYPGGITYTSSSGIWQPVWLEPMAAAGVQSLGIVPDVDNARLKLTVNTASTSGVIVAAKVLDGGTVVSTTTGGANVEIDIPVANPKLWSPASPFLYGLQITVSQNGTPVDSVTSYFGMRKIAVVTIGSTRQIYLNNQRIFAMGPLDQGFWPDGLYTAPTDDALKFDLQTEKMLGYNMVRKHIKVERQRWYYWADTLGLMVWQDMPSVNSYTGNPQPVDAAQFETELRQMVLTHGNTPAIVMWTIFNEGQGQDQQSTDNLVPEIQALDPSRLVNQASGGSYYKVGDIFDDHDYPVPGNPSSATQATVDGEFGGINFRVPGHLWNPSQTAGVYTTVPNTAQLGPLYDTYLTDLVSDKAGNGLNGAVYTEITDVETETNGLMTYDRLLKPDWTAILKSNQKAITGYYTTPTTVLPTSQTTAQTWKYTTDSATANTNWYATGFNDSAWKSGPAGFGTANTPGAVVGTKWSTADIWLRQQFTVGTLTPAVLNTLQFSCFHDEDCEIYLNGVLAGSATGYSTGYVLLPLTDAGRAALAPNGTNLIAVHCHQTTGGQDIDVGLVSQSLVANSVALPADAVASYHLDETGGTAASDSSGYADNGTVTSPLWTAAGKIGGCLGFNGTSSQVQITNPLSADLSLVFWVKTTQTGGTGQWYNGTGLVDGDVAGSGNDFGTALCGGKLAFGVGNPDVTLLSTTAINDGAWHHCAATRAAATGTLKVYVDGVLQATGTGGTQALTAAAALHFGNLQSGGHYFNGSLDEVKLFNRELGDQEVAALYNDGLFPPMGPTLTASVTSTQITLGWSGVLWATGYHVKRATASGGPYTTLATATLPAYTDTTGVGGTTYYYVVSAVNSEGEGANSNEVSELAGPHLTWYDANALTGLTDGAAVATWPDTGGTGINATQTSPAQQPNYIAKALNGYPVVRFSAANATYLSLPRPVQDDFTLLCVFRSTVGIGTNTAFYSGAGLVNGEVSGSTNDFGTSINANGQVLAGTGAPDVTAASGSAVNYLDGNPHVLTFERTESTGALVLYVDGAQAATATGGTQSLSVPAVLTIGCQQVLDNFFTGDIAEVKIFDAALPDTMRSAQEGTLESKYGLAAPPAPTSLGTAHATGSASLSWNPAVGATGYHVERAAASGGPYTTLAAVASPVYTDGSLGDGQSAYYVVTALNGAGESPASNVAFMGPAPVSAAELGAPRFVLASGTAQTTVATLPGRTYQLQRSDTLAPTSWVNVGSAASGTGGNVTLADPASTSGAARRFYRVLISP